MAAHWAEAVQAVQVLVAGAQTGMLVGQLALVTHPTHVPKGEQSVCAGSPSVEHCDEAVQGTHDPATQMGSWLGQAALAKHWTHRLVVVSHLAVVPEQVVSSRHCTHDPPAEQTTRAGSPRLAHWAAELQPTHSPPEQIGALAGQEALLSHWGLAASAGSRSSSLSMGASPPAPPSTQGIPPSAGPSAQPATLLEPSQTQTRRLVSHRKPRCTDVQSTSVVHVTTSDLVGKQLMRATASATRIGYRILEPQG